MFTVFRTKGSAFWVWVLSENPKNKKKLTKLSKDKKTTNLTKINYLWFFETKGCSYSGFYLKIRKKIYIPIYMTKIFFI